MVIFLIIYLVTIILSYGVTFAFIQRKWPVLAEADYAEDMAFSALFAMLGPCMLLATIFLCERYKYGIKFW